MAQTAARRLTVIRVAEHNYRLVYMIDGVTEPTVASDKRFRRAREAFAFALKQGMGVARQVARHKKT